MKLEIVNEKGNTDFLSTIMDVSEQRVIKVDGEPVGTIIKRPWGWVAFDNEEDPIHAYGDTIPEIRTNLKGVLK